MEMRQKEVKPLTVEQAAVMLGVSERTVYRWLKRYWLMSLAPAEVAYRIRSGQKKTPRGKPFQRGYDARRHPGFGRR